VPNADVQKTYVFRQSPQPGERIAKGNFVTIYVSTGPPQTEVPKVVGQSLDDALAELQDAKLKSKTVRVDSAKPEGIVVAQKPGSGAKVDEGSVVTLNVSKGPQPVSVPNVVGMSFDSASSTLQAQGLSVARGADVESDQPANTVVDQSPAAGTSVAPGTSITLRVSKGPSTSSVPDVTSLSQNDAVAQLRASGFRVRIVSQDVDDPDQDGIVQAQDPSGGSQSPPNTLVTISVGRFTGTTTGP